MTDLPEVTTTVAALADVLALAAPFCEALDRPSLAGVWLEAGGGVLCATATDRFVVGHARVACDGEWPHGVLLPRRHVDGVLVALGQPNEFDEHATADVGPVALGVVGEQLKIGWSGLTMRISCPAPAEDLYVTVGPAGRPRRDRWIHYAALFRPGGGAKVDGDPPMLSAHVLAPFVAASRRLGQPMRVTVTGERRPVRIEIGSQFVGLAMPSHSAPWSGPVPVGLPVREVVAVPG